MEIAIDQFTKNKTNEFDETINYANKLAKELANSLDINACGDIPKRVELGIHSDDK